MLSSVVAGLGVRVVLRASVVPGAWCCAGRVPGALALDRDGRVLSVLALDVRGGEVHAVRSVVNPDKLRHLGPVGDYGALLGETRHRG